MLIENIVNFLISLALQAIVFYELAFHFNPHCAEACNNLGVIYKDQDNLDKAVECYQVGLLRSLVIQSIPSFSYMTFYNVDIVDFLSFFVFFFSACLINKTQLFSVLEQSWCCLHGPGACTTLDCSSILSGLLLGMLNS